LGISNLIDMPIDPKTVVPKKRLTNREWVAEQQKNKYIPTYKHSPEEFEELLKLGKYPEYMDPSKYKFDDNGGVLNIDGTIAQNPEFIRYQAPIRAPKIAPAPKPMPVEGHKSLTHGAYQITDQNTGKMYDPTTPGKEVLPITQLKKGGLVKKIKGYKDGSYVEYDENGFPIDPNAVVQTGLSAAQKGLSPAKMNTAGVNAGIGIASGLAEMGGQYLDSTNKPNELGKINENKATWAGAAKGAGKGASIGAGIGSIIPGFGTVAGGAIGAGIGAGVGAFTANKKADEANNAIDAQLAEQEKLKQEQSRNKKLQDAFALREQGFSKGGIIKGAGTGKSDSIKGKIEANSFIVPAENAPIAKEIAKKVLKAPSIKKANLTQEGGENVKVSNGEYVFAPEEVMELKAKGIDVDALAPDAKNHLTEYLKCGGKVKGYKGYAKGGDVEGDDDEKFINDKRKELDALKNELDIAASKKAKTAEEKRLAENRKIAYQAAKERFDNSVKEFQKAKDAYKRYEEALKTDKYSGGTSANLGKLKAELDNVDKLRRKVKENADVIEKSNPSVKTTTTSSNKESSTGLDFMSGDKPKVPVLSSSTGSEIEKKLGTQEKAILKAPSAKSIKKAEAEQALTQATDLDKKIAAEGDTTLSDLADLDRFNKAQQAAPSQSGLARLVNQDVNTNGELEAALADAEARNKIDPKVDYGNSLSKGLTSLFDYGIPLAQTAVGLSFLNKQGKRPVDKLDPDYLASIESSQGIANEAKKRAQFGFTPEEQFMIDQRNQGLLNQGRAAARNYSGGSAGNAFNQERLSINDSFNRGLAAKVQGQNLMLGKQQYADAKQAETNRMMGDKAEMSRMLFNDTLGAWQQGQSAGAGLVNTGLSNLVSAGRYRNELDMYNDRKQKYGI